MALDADVLSEMAFARYQEKMQAQHPAVVRHRTMSRVPRSDGTEDFTFSEDIGPVEVRREDIMPLLSALAEAIVEHITEHAEVQNVSAGGLTRSVT